MAWTYGDYDQQSTASGKLTRLRLHLQEVRDALQSGDVSAHGFSKGIGGLTDYYQGLKQEERELSAALDTAGGFPRARFTRAG